MFRKLIHIALFGAFMFSACGVATQRPINMPETPKGDLPSLTGNWTITMTHSGGIMGLSRSVAIDSTGNYTVRDDRTDKTTTGQLSEDELGKLIEVVRSSTYSPNTDPYGCADCFIYNIEITSNGGIFSAQVDDVTIEKSGLANLVAVLRDILERELK